MGYLENIKKLNLKRRTRTDYIVVHCSATKPGMDIGATEIDRWHRERGWMCIGYHFVIRRDGTVELGRDSMTPGAHAAGYNAISLGICLVGGINDDGKADANFTDSQFTTLATLLDASLMYFPNAQVLGHRDLPGVNKACPCFDVQAWYVPKENNDNA